MMVRKTNAIISIILMLFIFLTILGCNGQKNKTEQGSTMPQQQNEPAVIEEADVQQDNQVAVEQSTDLAPDIFIQMLENHPLHRSGDLSPDNRYYAYEERSSIILVRFPTVEEYRADETLAPKVLFTDGRRRTSSFAEIEADYIQRLRQPLLTEEEINEARYNLRSVYDWNNFYGQKFSQDGRYLAYLSYSGFGRDRTCTVCVLEIDHGCAVNSLPIEENGEYAEINWQEDKQTLEIYLPWAERIKEGYLALRRSWHISSGEIKSVYYDTESGQEVAWADAQEAIVIYAQEEAESNRAAEELARLTVQERVAVLMPEELEAEYTRYFSLHAEQVRELEERGYSSETIAGMDSLDFEKEEQGWLISEDGICHVRNIYPELEDVDLSQWTYQDLEDYVLPLNEAHNAPPEALRKEILERGLPANISSRVSKEFHGWENMLAYTNEAIMAMYEAAGQTEALFEKEEAYRLAVREAYRAQENH